MKRLYKLLCVLLCLALAAALCVPVFAADPADDVPQLIVDDDDENVVYPEEQGNDSPQLIVDDDDAVSPGDPGSDNPQTIGDDKDSGSDAAPDDVDVGIIQGMDNVSFDSSTREFIYPVGNSGTEVRASVANGMLANAPVKIKGVTLIIYRDGQKWEGDATRITDPGDYVVMAQTGNDTPRLFTFTLVGDAISNIYTYNLPAGMLVISATLDGEPTPYDSGSVPMQDEGLYHVEYEYVGARAYFSLDVKVDRTPPEVLFEGTIDEKNRVHSSLRFSGLEPGDTIRATLDGQSVEIPVKSDGTGEILQSGVYHIYVYDAAGNVSEYAYTILMYLNSSGTVFLILLIVSILAVAIYVVVKRRRLQIG